MTGKIPVVRSSLDLDIGKAYLLAAEQQMQEYSDALGGPLVLDMSFYLALADSNLSQAENYGVNTRIQRIVLHRLMQC